MLQPDNWGWKARIGMFIVASEAVPEAEWWAMMPSGVSVHAARVTARAPWASWDGDRATVALEPDLERGAKQFAAMRLSSVVIGHSSSSIAGGKGWDAAIVERLSAMFPSETQVTTNGLDCQAALRAASVKRPFVVFPPWFGEQTLDAGVQYFADHGTEPAGRLQYDPGLGWRDVAPGELYAKGMGFEQDVEALYRQIRAACPATADGVIIVGTGFRCVAILDALERDLQRPVISANQASLWNGLRLAGMTPSIKGYGSLLNGSRDLVPGQGV